MSMQKRILVVAETFEPTADRMTEEAVVAASALGGDVVLAVLGPQADGRARAMAAWRDVARVITFDQASIAQPLARPWADAVEAIIANVEPTLVIVPATLAGRDYTARVAARLDVPIASDVIALSQSDAAIVARRQVRGNRYITDVTLSARMSIVTLRPGTVRKRAESGGTADVERIEIADIAPSAIEVLHMAAAGRAEGSLASAERIVSGGRGLGKPENFALVEDLAAQLDAAVGASGATVGMGWRPHSQQVGSTGTMVAPRLYLAVGISGAVQHTIGMSGSEYIVAINRDPEAPIFQIAALGVVGDLFEIIPAMIEELRVAD
jgi:electron transfer flavoprotein alpha subunit